MATPSKDKLKECAKSLRKILHQKYSVEVSHGHALEIFAKVFGFKDWNTASALSAEASNGQPVTNAQVSEEKPIAAKFQNVGELKRFLTKFDDGTKLVVNEYQWSRPDSNNHNFETVTSVCSLTYDSEIQNGTELCLELNTETERNLQLQSFGESATQSFHQTPAGRSQRRIKYLELLRSSTWNPSVAPRS